MSKSYLVNNITYEQRQLQLKYPCTDVGNMMRFINQHQKVIRCYGNSREWLIWDGTRWKRTSNKDIFSLALNSINSIAFEAKKCPSVEGTQALRKWLLTSQSEAKINAMINMASKHPNISVSLSQFDKLDNFLNCKKATINLNNGSTSKNDPLKSFTKVTNASHNKDAHCPTFKKFILDIFNGDNELIEWFQRAIGYTITGSTKEQLLFIAHGKGANGKSTLFELIRDILGDYAITSDFETFINNNNSEVRQMESIGELKGVRFVLASEVDPSVRFREALVKKLTGGDNLRGTKLRSSAFQFKPEFKIWLLCNHLPFAREGS